MSNQHLFQIGRKSAMVFGAALALWTVAWPASTPVRSDPTTAPSDLAVNDPKDGDTITVEPNGKGKEVNFELKIHQANILNPDVADVHPLGTNELLITGKKTGSTQMIITDETDHASVLNIEVSSPIELLRKQLHTLFPDSSVAVEDDNGTLTLTGQAHDLMTAEEITQVAQPYGVKVLNLMEISGGQQVMLKVKFAEVSKQAEQELGFNFGGQDGVSFLGFGSNIGKNALAVAPGSSIAGNTLISGAGAATSLFGQGGFDKILFDYFIDALEQNSLVRTLAEPNLVTTSGQEATFLAGGSFPYPVPQTGTGGGSTITIQFQDYGVNLKFTPIVLGNGRIRLKVAPEVSELDFANAVSLDGTTVPGLTKRNVNTTVELAEGQTFALAGLLQDTVTASNNQLPILGDVPVLGALFRSVQYQKNETELVVLVTPVLVHGIDPGDVTPAVGEKWRDPTHAQLYALKDLGGEEPTPAEHLNNASGQAPTFEGSAGFSPPPSQSH
jgi:pilus assembly protein CpaC